MNYQTLKSELQNAKYSVMTGGRVDLAGDVPATDSLVQVESPGTVFGRNDRRFI